MFETVQESVNVCTTGMFRRALYAQHPVTKNLHIYPRLSLTIFYRDANSGVLLAHLYIVDDESVKVYLHMYNGNVQQNPPFVESCVIKEFSISPRFSPTIFGPDANLVLLIAHLYTGVNSMRRNPCARNCS